MHTLTGNDAATLTPSVRAQHPFGTSRINLICAAWLMVAEQSQDTQITAGTRAQATPAAVAVRHGCRGSQAT